MRLRIFVLLVGVLASGCAVGNRYAYHSVVASPKLSGTGAVSIGTHDQREDVLSGKKSPEFVGVQRGGFGNPFDVKTGDARPLADAMTSAIVSTLARKGFRTRPISVAHGVPPAEARQRLLAVGTDRALLLTLREWKSDTAVRVGLSYDVSLSVLDRTGAVLAEKRVEGRDNLGGVMVPSQAEEAVSQAFKTKLELLLDDPAVTAALRSGP